jgi:hypothetical protein
MNKIKKDEVILNNDIPKINIKEFRELGYLQELNRRFLHPLGLALEIIRDSNGTESLGGIWDYRNQNEGIYYDYKESDLDRINNSLQKKSFIDDEIEKRFKIRKEILGFDIEPIQ